MFFFPVDEIKLTVIQLLSEVFKISEIVLGMLSSLKLTDYLI